MQQSPSVKPKVQGKPFDKDFIILSEFSEQVGPVPVYFIPDESSKGTFDTSHFSVRIMTSDYQSQRGKLVGEDTQVLLSEKQDQVYAYVHYFSLNDFNARGYVRQYCFSYITSSLHKLVDNFELLKQQFCEVTSMLKCGNRRVFRKDLEHHLADLNLTMAELKAEGWMDIDIDSSKLYQGFDFAMEDVPERDPQQVSTAINDTSEVLNHLKKEMDREENKRMWSEVRRLRQLRKSRLVLQSLKDKPPNNTSPAVRRFRAISLGSPDSGNTDLTLASFTDSISSELTNSTSSINSHYQPQRVMTHTVHKFERRLRPLQELSYKAYSIVMDKLNNIHKFFSRSEITLEMEKEETLLLDPRSSLLSIGRVPMVNFLQNFHHFLSIQPCPLLQPRAYTISARNTWGQPSDFSQGEVVVNGEAAGTASGFDTAFVEERSCLNKYPLYVDLSHSTLPYTFSFATDPETSLNQSTLTDTLVRNGSSPTELRPPDLRDDTIALTVNQEEDQISRGSRGSPAYLTPEGLTPSPSDGDVNSGSGPPLSEEEVIKKATHLTDDLVNGAQNGERHSIDDFTSLDTAKRTLSQQSFASAGSSLSIQGDQLGGKTTPTITTSVVTAQAKASHRSRSLSPQGIGSSTSSESVSFILNSYSKELLPNNHRGHMSLSSTPRQLDDMAQAEETQSAGSGHFENGPIHLQPSRSEPVMDKKPSESVVSHPRVGKPLGLPRQASVMSGQISPEKYHTPVGEAPSVFDADSAFFSPSRQSLASQVSTVSFLNTYRGPSLVELRGKGKLPLISSVDLVECDLKFRPGKGIYSFCKDNTSVKDLFYCLLHGRPLAIIGRPSDERDIRRLVRLLWMFVPGHSSKQQIITWQDKPLDVKDLSRVKLIGLSNKAVTITGQGSKTVSIMGNSLKRHMSLWDISTGKIMTPSYNGDMLKPIVSRKDRKNEPTFMAHLISVLLDISMKAYVYYHCYCASAKPPRQSVIGETTAKVYHSVLQRDSPQRQRSIFLQSLNIRGSDVDIVEYLVDIIREQQLTEWRNGPPAGTPFDEEPVTFKLYTKHCRESTHKPKRAY